MLRSLPVVEDQVINEISLISYINQTSLETLKTRTLHAIKSGKHICDKKAEAAVSELEKISAWVDTLAESFDQVESGEAPMELLQGK